jgi:hypothetical protein
MNRHAQALGRLAEGKKKKISRQESDRRRQSLARSRLLCWKEKIHRVKDSRGRVYYVTLPRVHALQCALKIRKLALRKFVICRSEFFAVELAAKAYPCEIGYLR